MSQHRAYVTTVHDRGAHTTELFGSVSRQGSSCRDPVPRHVWLFGLQQRLSLSRQILVNSMSRQKFSVATGYWARTGCLGPNKGPLVSQQGFPSVGLSLLR